MSHAHPTLRITTKGVDHRLTPNYYRTHVNRWPSASAELNLRALRYFVAVAEDLHFTRAASRLYIAQQALSREIANLERELGVALFVRTTRHVKLTPAGERLLERARELIALHDRVVGDVLRASRPVLANLHSPGRQTGRRVLDVARAGAREIEFRGRYGSGFGEALTQLMAGEIDVAFGRVAGGRGTLPPGLEQRLIRFEPLALLLPSGHALAQQPAVLFAALHDEEIDAGLGNPKAPEWVDLAAQLLDFAGARATPPHVPAEGLEEQAHHLTRQGLPILTSLDHVAVPGGELRAIVDPTPVYPWSIVYRTEGDAVGVRALLDAAAQLAEQERWLDRPADAWLPEPESTRLSS